ncbi:Protein phosphatase 2C and cyclic nucleotide-binding/kinase domain-containing protein [Vitis vinifera]|uniref:Protein phosphatase 2C and cyclic nucleotide-binding/kinase domain-containing protein n=1 Tax=Vitis vinifera TaxID=29760 RepID=A0A438DSD1_VITVI|nr:Protein phosphatase 2C and cyclic nucleotide-binding/kinase domain-containing protein [Vitis vinifera]
MHLHVCMYHNSDSLDALVLLDPMIFLAVQQLSSFNLVTKFKDPRDACAAIVAESYRLWLQYETRTDDITVIVVHINGLTDSTDFVFFHQPDVGQSANPGAISRPPVPQVVEVTGSESPSTLSWNSRNHRVRHDLSRARLRAIESSLENGQIWVPPSPAHRKTWEEEAHIERALHDHFLFRKLTDSQCHVLLDCMQRVEVQSGDVVVKQASSLSLYFHSSSEYVVDIIGDENLYQSCKYIFATTFLVYILMHMGRLMLLDLEVYFSMLNLRVVKVTAFMLLAVENLRSWQPRTNIKATLIIILDQFNYLLVFQLYILEEEKNGEVTRVLQQYTAEKLSSFGELALMYNKPLQASVRAVTNGTLWALKREDFRGILMSEFSNLSSLKLLRSVDLLSRLTILQLSHIADSLSEVSFSDGQTIVDKNEGPVALYIIQKGQVRITFDPDSIRSPSFGSLVSDNQKQDDDTESSTEFVVKTEGSYFGEWALLGENIGSFSAVAMGDVVCAVLTKEKFDAVVGPLAKLSQGDEKSRDHSRDYSSSLPKESVKNIDPSTLTKVQPSDLEWRTCLYSTDCSEIGLVLLRDSENLLSLKRFSKQKIKRLGKEAQVLKEKNLMMSMAPSACVPQVLCTIADQNHASILLNTCLACPFASILHTPLDEPSARFCAASVVIALENLHKNGILYRGVSPDVLMFDHTGHLQLVDFRFGKKLADERTFTICGMADSLAPEIVQGKGHGFPADWWALGVLIYFMLQGEMPFGSWRESELDTFAKIARGQLNLPCTFSPEAVDLITKLLEVDESTRLGSQNPDSVKSHKWFDGIDWKRLTDSSFPVPHEITSRIAQHLENHTEDYTIHSLSPSRDPEELNTPEWLEEW